MKEGSVCGSINVTLAAWPWNPMTSFTCTALCFCSVWQESTYFHSLLLCTYASFIQEPLTASADVIFLFVHAHVCTLSLQCFLFAEIAIHISAKD